MKKLEFLHHLFLLISIVFLVQCADKRFIEVPDKIDTSGGTISGVVSNTTNITPYGVSQRTDGKYLLIYGDANKGLKSVIMNGNQIVNSTLMSYSVGQVIINATKLTSDNNILLIGNNKTNDSVFVGLIKTETQILEWQYKIASPTASPVIGQDILAKSADIFLAIVSNAPNKPFLIQIEPILQKKQLIFIDLLFHHKAFIPTSIVVANPIDGNMVALGSCEGITSKYYFLSFRITDIGTLTHDGQDSIVTKQAIDNKFNIKTSLLYSDQLIYISSFGAGHLSGHNHIDDNSYSDAAINRDSTTYIGGNNTPITGNQLVIRKVNLEMQDKLPVRRITNPALALKTNKIIRTADDGYLLLATAAQMDSNTSLYIVKGDKNGNIQ